MSHHQKKVDVGAFGTIRVDIRTKDHGGGSAQNLSVDDPDTDVSFGNIHARVTFKSLNLEVIMDPREGNWKDAKWARREAWNALRSRLTVKDFSTVMTATLERGRKQGEEQALANVRRALGIKERNFSGGGFNE